MTTHLLWCHRFDGGGSQGQRAVADKLGSTPNAEVHIGFSGSGQTRLLALCLDDVECFGGVGNVFGSLSCVVLHGVDFL